MPLAHTDNDHRRSIGFEAPHERSRGAEQLRHFVRDCGEHLLGADAPRHQRGHPPQRRLLVGQLASARLRRCQVGARLVVRDRRGNELYEVVEAILGSRREVPLLPARRRTSCPKRLH